MLLICICVDCQFEPQTPVESVASNNGKVREWAKDILRSLRGNGFCSIWIYLSVFFLTRVLFFLGNPNWSKF